MQLAASGSTLSWQVLYSAGRTIREKTSFQNFKPNLNLPNMPRKRIGGRTRLLSLPIAQKHVERKPKRIDSRILRAFRRNAFCFNVLRVRRRDRGPIQRCLDSKTTSTPCRDLTVVARSDINVGKASFLGQHRDARPDASASSRRVMSGAYHRGDGNFVRQAGDFMISIELVKDERDF